MKVALIGNVTNKFANLQTLCKLAYKALTDQNCADITHVTVTKR